MILGLKKVLKSRVKLLTFKLMMKKNLTNMVNDLLKDKKKREDGVFYRKIFESID